MAPTKKKELSERVSHKIYSIIGTHCLEPPIPPNDTCLEIHKWNGNPIDFNTAINYVCSNGMKFYSDFDKELQNATCRPENLWDVPEPEWPKCVESKAACTLESNITLGYC